MLARRRAGRLMRRAQSAPGFACRQAGLPCMPAASKGVLQQGGLGPSELEPDPLSGPQAACFSLFAIRYSFVESMERPALACTIQAARGGEVPPVIAGYYPAIAEPQGKP